MEKKVDNNDLPFTSIVMPVRNEALYIEKSLNSVVKQNYPADKMEIIISDGMSEDNTRSIVNRIKEMNDTLAIRIIDNIGLIAPTGLNAAIRHAKGNIIIRVDGHCEIEKDYVQRCVNHLLESRVDGVGGPITTIGETSVSDSIAVGMSSLFGVGGSAFRTYKDKAMPVDTVPFPAYTREIIIKAGPYDEELVRNQDDEYNYRVRKIGGRLLLSPDIKSRYYSRGSLRTLWKQYYQYGFWKVRVLQKHPRQMSLRQFIPPAFVFSLIALSILSLFSRIGAGVFVLVVGSYVLANFLASIITAAKKGWKHIFLLPIVFAILHLSYGTGFLVGLIKFANRWRQAEVSPVIQSE